MFAEMSNCLPMRRASRVTFTTPNPPNTGPEIVLRRLVYCALDAGEKPPRAGERHRFTFAKLMGRIGDDVIVGILGILEGIRRFSLQTSARFAR